ncbi:hypothetical protein [Burkholderia gladioli]|uniref:hypothetical protein n=1 Tax=Burkholderia gladioli TaxID=28095 RepID=UPI00163E8DB5|nr:hypothetical protein [Burkholderia gladioli]
MTNNTTAALTDDEREKLIDLVDRLIRNPDAVTAKDCIIGNDVRTVQWIAEHTRALLTSPRAAGLPGHVRFSMESTARWLEGGCDPLAAAKEIRACLAKLDAAPAAPVAEAEPIPMLLFCPRCGTQHIDAPEDAECDGEVVHSAGWSNPPHRSHLCHACDCIWRPADVATVGVASIKTHGKADTWEGMAGVTSMPAQAVAADGAQLDEDRIDWIANAHCPGGTAYPVNVKNAIREALREARAAVSPATAESKCTRCGASTAQACNERGCFYLESGEGEPATADERAAFERWMVEDEKCIVGSADPYPAGIERQNWKVWRAAWARASQAAAPADHPCIAPACGVWDGNSECTCKKAAAPADAREPGRVGRADIVGGRVHSFAFEQTDIPTGSYSLYTAPVSPPADAGEAVAIPAPTWIDADMVWLADDGESFYASIDDAVQDSVDQDWPDKEPRELKLRLGMQIPTATVRIFDITENGHEWEVVDRANQGAQGEKGGEA